MGVDLVYPTFVSVSISIYPHFIEQVIGTEVI